MGHLVDYTTERGVALLTINDPPVNSYTHELLTDLDACITDARFDTDVSVVIITGHGENYFSAGANITMLREVDPGFRYNFFLCASETMTRIEHTPKLVIAALNGHAVGGGMEIALACDLRIARAHSGTIGLPELNLGLLPGGGGTQRLARFVSKGQAMQMILEGTKLDFEEARRIGLVNEVWETPTHTDFIERVVEYAHRFTAPGKSPLAVGRVKRAVQAAYELPIEQGQALERELHAQLLGSADADEGLAAWIAKRTASFQGR
ncbi:MAG: enoyl-CoA hydratase/isomerase family protein [Polyangiaceae bacterium]|jgi:enoyl-CoA hydratase/carnithine racemase|nr:enoyl-CoA hydratase/isomerase family protein [Polyangiaceae bacterium]